MEQQDVILIVDDTPINLVYILEFLSRKGFKVLVAQNGEEGIEVAKLAHPDLILLDVMMPNLDGFQVCQFLKSQEETQAIPIIFMTVLTESSHKVRGFQVGAADYITKPFDQEETLVRINTHLKLSQLQRQLVQQNQALQQEVNLRKHTEETLRVVLEATTDVILMFNQEGICMLVNPKGANKLGMEVTQMKGKSIENLFPQDLVAPMRNVFNKVMSTQHSELFEVEFHGLWFEVNCDRIDNGSGVVFYARDITGRKEISKALQLSQERYVLAVSAGKVGVWDWNTETQQFYCDSLLGSALPHSFQEWSDLVYSEDREAVLHTIHHGLQHPSSHSYEFEYRMLHKDGNLHWFIARGSVIHHAHGGAYRLVGTETDITEQKRLQETLKISYEQFATVLDSLEIGIFVVDLKTYKFLFTNQYFKEFCHHETSLSMNCWEVFYPHQQTPCHFCTNSQEHQATGRSHLWEIYHPESKKWFYGQSRVIRWIDGAWVDLEVITDITARKQAEAHLAQLGQVTEQLLKLPLIIFRITSQGILIEAQGAGLDVLGLNHQKVIGSDFFKFFPQTHPYVELALAGVPQHFSYTFKYKKRTLCYETFLTLDKIEKNLIGIALDITERIAAIEALREHEEYRHTLIREASIGLGLFEDDLLVEANPTFAQILGYSVEEIYAKQLRCYIQDLTPSQYLAIDEEQKRLLEQKGRFGPYEKECFHKAGHLVPVRLSGVMIPYKQHCFLWTTLEDISDRKRVEEALRDAKEVAEIANHTKTAFLANMSHELRTPLNGILGHTQLLVQDPTLTSQQIESISIIQRNGEYLLTLISDILDLSKIETQRLELFPTTFLFEKFIREINDFTRMNAMQRGLTFNYQVLTPLPKMIRADEIRLRQVLINLLSNAIKFTKQGQVQFKVSTFRRNVPGECKLGLGFQIEDTGIGISPQDISKVFTPFQQFGERNYRDRGTGLGLALSKRLVEMMGGELHLESSLDQGTKVEVEINLEEESTSPIQEELSLIKACILLIIDTQWENRVAVVDLLTPLGFKVIEAKNAQEGVEKAIQSTPDGILIDFKMFMMNECEAIEQIKQLSKLKKIPLIVCADALEETSQRGSDHVIVKPFQQEVLLEKLQYCLKTKQLDEHLRFLVPQGVKIEDFSSLEGPSSEEASQLLRLAKMGDVYGIFDFLEKLEKKRPTLLPFIDKTRLLAKQFDHELICEVARFYL